MYPIMMSDVAKHRIADWHRQADRARTVRAARAIRKKQASRRLSVTLAGLAAAALALPAGQGTATAATFTPPPTPAMATVQQAPTSLTVADLHDIAKVKRDLFWRLAKRSPTR